MLQTSNESGTGFDPCPKAHFILDLDVIQIDLAPYKQTLSEHGISMSMLMEFVLFAWASMVYSNLRMSDGYFYNEVFEHITAVLTDCGIISDRDLSGDRLVVVCVEASELIYLHLEKSLEKALQFIPHTKLDNLFLVNWVGTDPVIEIHFTPTMTSL